MHRPEIPSLTGLRFLAAATVILSHTAGYFLLPAHSVFADVRIFGFLGMTLFFVLSGFVIHYNYGETLGCLGGVRDFSVARFARLYPLYLLTLLAVAAFPGSTANQPFYSHWLYAVTATQSWFPVEIGDDQWLANIASGTWSISDEIFLYFLYIPLARYVARLSLRQSLIVMAVALFTLTVVYGGRMMSWWLTPVNDGYWFYFSPYCRLPEFLIGVITAQIAVRLPAKATPAEHRIGGIISTYSLASIFFYFFSFWLRGPLPHLWSHLAALQSSGGLAPACAGLIYCGARFRQPILEWRPIVAMGTASYSLYLLHPWFFEMFSAQGAGEGLLMWAKIAAAWIFVTVSSLGCYLYFERPARSWLRRLLAPRFKPEASAAEAAAFSS